MPARSRRRSALPVLLFVFFLGVSSPPDLRAGCVRGAVACANMAPTRTCTATLKCMTAPGLSTWYIFYSAGSNVTRCDPGTAVLVGPTVTFNITAKAKQTAPNPRTCVWNWSTKGGSAESNVTIRTADGLPVELMEFSVESAEASGEARDEKGGTSE